MHSKCSRSLLYMHLFDPYQSSSMRILHQTASKLTWSNLKTIYKKVSATTSAHGSMNFTHRTQVTKKEREREKKKKTKSNMNQSNSRQKLKSNNKRGPNRIQDLLNRELMAKNFQTSIHYYFIIIFSSFLSCRTIGYQNHGQTQS